jgi:cellulose synthase/poly-beta-1,6-N-acetylglucosamine synthase-like glycosyltransferase
LEKPRALRRGAFPLAWKGDKLFLRFWTQDEIAKMGQKCYISATEMHGISSIILYILSFLSVYIQVVFLLTFLEKRREIKRRTGPIDLVTYPKVTIIVPCWNEETTIQGTVESLLALDYPKELLKIFLIDDGSTDGTWKIMQSFVGVPQIEVFQKENGGKHTAVNLGLSMAESPFVGCLDSDSFVDSQALKRIMTYFERDASVMAVCPSILVHKPKGLMQVIQRVEYDWAVFRKKILGILGANYVTPGPFSIYKKEVFERLGYFRKAHNTEDMEIAFRMQKHHFKIDQCEDAFVYTKVPNTVKKLYKQRLRWIYGFIMNAWDYRKILFRPKFGSFSMFSVPAGVISILAVPYLLSFFIFNTAIAAQKSVEQISMTGFHFGFGHFDPFFVSTAGQTFIVVILYIFLFVSISIGRKMVTGKHGIDYYTIPFMIIFNIIAPFWILKALYNSIFVRKGVAWR